MNESLNSSLTKKDIGAYFQDFSRYSNLLTFIIIVLQNGFDGTRFDGISQPAVLPPPPPGVANAAQLAAMAGHSVALSQKKGSFLGGGTEGGYTFW